MLGLLCAIFGLAALLGVPASGAIFCGTAGMLMGLAAGRVLLPHREWGRRAKAILLFAAVGEVLCGSFLSILDFFTVRGLFLWGLNLGFWPVAVTRLASTGASKGTRGKNGFRVTGGIGWRLRR